MVGVTTMHLDVVEEGTMSTPAPTPTTHLAGPVEHLGRVPDGSDFGSLRAGAEKLLDDRRESHQSAEAVIRRSRPS